MTADLQLDILKQGAEARLYKVDYMGRPTIIKERFKKKYRVEVLDENILKERMKAEVRGLLRSKIAGVATPALYLLEMDSRRLYLQYISGSTVKDYIDSLLSTSESTAHPEISQLTERIGSALAKIHNSNLIHGDLTTSNMLMNEDKTKLYLIDFGLSFVSSSAEDKGVDLYVLERALTSTHANSEHLFKLIIKTYSSEYKSGSKEVLKKYDEVKARGRKRTMVG